MNETFLNAVYDLLIEHGSSEAYRADFVRYMLDEKKSPHEWRFCGVFGFGGKC